MKRAIFLLHLLLLPVSVMLAQQAPAPGQVAGSWSGSLQVGGMALPLIFHINKNTDDRLTATMDSPQQGAKGIPVQEVKLVGDSLCLAIQGSGGGFVGKFTGPETLVGQWRQGGHVLPLQLRKGEVEAQRRPQEPQPPYPYQEQEVSVNNQEAGIQLAGTLTYPEENGTYPAVILLTGSGAQDRDMSLLGHKPFLVLADYLTRQGFAVLRLDDRGAGKSGGNAATATTADYASDARAAYAYLQKRKEIAPEKIGLLGISEGALIAAKVAAENKAVAFVVLLAGSAVPGTELLLAQNEAIHRASGTPAVPLQKLLALRRKQFEAAASTADSAATALKIRALEQEAKRGMAEEEQAQLGLTPENEAQIVAQLSTPWLRYFLAYNPASTLQQLKMPVLALYGSKDLQVPAAQNLPATEKALQAAGHKQFTVAELPGLNHLFQTASTGLHTEYAQIEETMAPLALEKISTWMKQMVKQD